MPCITLLVLQFLLIAELELAVPDSRYSHEYKDNKISVPKLNYCYMKEFRLLMSAAPEIWLHAAIASPNETYFWTLDLPHQLLYPFQQT